MAEVSIKGLGSQIWLMVTLVDDEQLLEYEIEALLIGLATSFRRAALRQYEQLSERRVEVLLLREDFSSAFLESSELLLILEDASGLTEELIILLLAAVRRRIDATTEGLQIQGLGSFIRTEVENFYYEVSLDPCLKLIAGSGLGSPKVMTAMAS